LNVRQSLLHAGSDEGARRCRRSSYDAGSYDANYCLNGVDGPDCITLEIGRLLAFLDGCHGRRIAGTLHRIGDEARALRDADRLDRLCKLSGRLAKVTLAGCIASAGSGTI